MTSYFYGAYNINDGQHTFLLEKPFDFVPVKQTMFKMARLEGMKKTGESIDNRTVIVKMKIIGTSRADLESRLSALNAALLLRQQQLSVYAVDGRYYVADAISSSEPLIAGQPISAMVTITFNCQQPYAYAVTTTTFDTGVLTLTGGSGSWVFPVQTFAGGGNATARPQIKITQSGTSLSWTSITVLQQTDNQQLVISSHLPTANGDFIDILCDPIASPNGQTIQLNDNGTLIGFTGQFPQLDPVNTSWLITIAAPSAPHARCVWAWTKRWLP